MSKKLAVKFEENTSPVGFNALVYRNGVLVGREFITVEEARADAGEASVKALQNNGHTIDRVLKNYY